MSTLDSRKVRTLMQSREANDIPSRYIIAMIGELHLRTIIGNDGLSEQFLRCDDHSMIAYHPMPVKADDSPRNSRCLAALIARSTTTTESMRLDFRHLDKMEGLDLQVSQNVIASSVTQAFRLPKSTTQPWRNGCASATEERMVSQRDLLQKRRST